MRSWGDEPRRNPHTGLKILGSLVVLIFAGTLAYVVGNRLSDEALGVLAGAVCGVGAAIPGTLLVLLGAKALRGGGRQQEPMMTRPMIVPPQVMYYPPQSQQEQRGPATWHSLPSREFTVVGHPED